MNAVDNTAMAWANLRNRVARALINFILKSVATKEYEALVSYSIRLGLNAIAQESEKEHGSN